MGQFGMLRITVEKLEADLSPELVGKFDVECLTDHPKFPKVANYCVQAERPGKDTLSFVVKHHDRMAGEFTLIKMIMDRLRRHR